jgi:para-nitrobenzyl esterase
VKHLLILLAILLGFALVVAGVVAWADDSGSSSSSTSSESTGLVGPVWEWEEFLGSDDSTIAPDDPSQYTIQFSEDGSVSVEADCNAGFGTYEEAGGSLTIELGGVTLAQCEPGSLSDRFLRDLGYVRTYVIDDGELFLNLMADGGDMHFGAA